MKDFAGRTAFVTGGAHGVGIGLVRALLAQDCNVAIADLRPASIEAALKALNNPAMACRRVAPRQTCACRGCGGGPVRARDPVVQQRRRQPVPDHRGIQLRRLGWIMANLHGPINGVMTFSRMIRAGKGATWSTPHRWPASSPAAPAASTTPPSSPCAAVRLVAGGVATHGIGVSVLCPGLVKSYIYASEVGVGALRGARPVDAEAVKRLAAVHEFGMEPDVIAARVLEAMREDRFHVFSHPEFRDELEEVFTETLADFRDYPADPGFQPRIDFEKTRRASYRQQRRGLKRP
jgi:NAD(P)-dependent dehydrogenase (short-subunit alcohol dehydrogenase family)